MNAPIINALYEYCVQPTIQLLPLYHVCSYYNENMVTIFINDERQAPDGQSDVQADESDELWDIENQV